MKIKIPPVSDVKGALSSLSHADVLELARVSGVPFTTVWKIRAGITENPGIDTVGKFWPHISKAKRSRPEVA